MRRLLLTVGLLLGLAPYCQGRDVLIAGGGDFVLTPEDLRLEVLFADVAGEQPLPIG